MTNEQINAAIAEACGWTHIEQCPPGGKFWGQHPWCPDEVNEAYAWPLPNYCTDLNAIHEAEMTLTSAQLLEYIALLFDACYEATVASARQRAEAFLRTLDKYKETYVSNPEKCPRCGAGLSYPIKDGHANYECNSFMTNEGRFGQDVMCARLEKITAPLLTQIEKLKTELLKRHD